MRVVITGGTGMIGRALTAELTRLGHEVIILSRSPQIPLGIPAGARVVRWDGASGDGWQDLADGAGAIINLAGENLSAGLWTTKRKDAILQSRLNAGKAVVEAVRAARKKPKVVLQASGVGAYGTGDTLALREDAPFGNDFLARISRDWEASTAEVETMGIRRVIARTGVVFDSNTGALPRMLLPFKLFAGGALGRGDQWLSWVHLQDEVNALLFLMENTAARGAYNIAAEPISNRSFASLAGRLLHRPAFLTIPAFILRLALGEMSMVVLQGQHVSNQKLRALGFKFLYPDAKSALKEILERVNAKQIK